MALLLQLDHPTFSQPMPVYVRVRSIQIDYDQGGEINLEIWLSEQVRRQNGKKPFSIISVQVTKEEQLDRENKPLSIKLSQALQGGEINRANVYNLLKTVTLRRGYTVYNFTTAQEV